MNYKIQAGLVPAGKNEDGEQLWLGTRTQWQKAEELENNAPDAMDEAKAYQELEE
mgnify:CR=1 FL=1